MSTSRDYPTGPEEDEDKYAEISVTVLSVGPNALLVLTDEGEDADETWIPNSLIKDYDDLELEEDAEIDIHVATWFAEKEGLV